jgi:acetyl-CoA acetyltransferase
MGEYVGALKDISAIDLGAVAAKATLEETGVKPEDIDHTIIGNALQTCALRLRLIVCVAVGFSLSSRALR